jgi:hypothetical protein
MKYTVIIRMGAAHWDARIASEEGTLNFNLRKMDKRQRADFHRELMNAYRATRQ